MCSRGCLMLLALQMQAFLKARFLFLFPLYCDKNCGVVVYWKFVVFYNLSVVLPF
jgi:hypothetical protein